MTPKQISLVQESFRRVLPIAGPAAAMFYDRLFALDPAVRPLFARADMAEQGRKLMATLGHVIGALNAPESVMPAVRDLGRRHAGFGVQHAHYATVGAALLWTLEQGLGEAFTAEVREAWGAAYAAVSGAMMDASGKAA